MTAQDRYRAMLRDEIAPALRARGFKGSGTSYVLPDDTHWLGIGFQASKWATYSRETAVWRLGSLAFGQDRWWRVLDMPHQTEGVAEQVVDAIDRVGLPLLRSKGRRS